MLSKSYFLRNIFVFVFLVSLSGCVLSTEQSAEPTASPLVTLGDEGSFIGKVTSYAKSPEGYGGDDQTTIYVDEKRVELDLIWPYSAGCMEREIIQDEAFISAQDALESILPLGTEVLVIKSNYENGEWVGDQSDGFLHKLVKGGKAPVVAPPSSSVNEELVLTGYWVPSGKGFDFNVYAFGAQYGKFEADYLSQKQEEYAPLILAAGNIARTNQSGAMPTCSTLALDYQIDFFYKQVAAFRNDEEKNRLWWIERNKARNCRDGDGDGICYER